MSKQTFKWEDPFLFSDQLTDEERMIRDTARKYCQDKLMPRILEANRHETFDRDIMNEMVGTELCVLWLDRLRSGTCGQWLSQCDECAEFAGDASHLHIRF